MAAKTVIKVKLIHSALVALITLFSLMPARGEEPQPPATARRIHLLVPGCGAALPLDAGQAFAGPRYLIWDDRLAFFEQTVSPQAQLKWRLTSSERLPAAPPAAGLGRARVKWRDGALWMKAGTRIYQRDAASRQWFLMADPGLDFRDFDVDLKGRILLVATANPGTRRYRALLEAVGTDRRSTEVLCEYPDPDFPRWFDQISPVAAATLLTGYESVQIQEYLVLFNPLARRVFVYQGIDGSLREATLGLPTRGVGDLMTRGTDDPPSPGDLCWQVLPKSNSEAWIVVPASIGASPPAASTPEPGLQAIVLDLVEGVGDTPVPLAGRLPLFFDPQGRLANLDDALQRLEADLQTPKGQPGNPATLNQPINDPEAAAPTGVRSGSPPG
jgi:hypothetical protein